jgi:hypothetical protein
VTQSTGPLRLQPDLWVEVVTDDEAMAGLLADRLRDLNDPTGSPRFRLEVRYHRSLDSHPWGVWRDGEECEPTLTTSYVVPYVLWELNRAVSEHRSGRVAVHAGAVELGGRGIVLCGASHNGKSTLTAWLTAHGWGFLTDELVTLQEPGHAEDWLAPYHRPVGLRRGGPIEPFMDATRAEWEPFAADEWVVPASLLGHGRLVERATFDAFVLPKYTPGAPTALLPIGPDEALLGICDQAPGLSLHGRVAFQRLAEWVRRVPSYRLIVDNLPEATRLLTEVLS